MSQQSGTADPFIPPVIPQPQSIAEAAVQLDRAQSRVNADALPPQLPNPTAKREVYQAQATAPPQLRAPNSYLAAPVAQVSSGRQGMAIASLVLGLVAFFTVIITGLGLFFGCLAVGLGLAARRNEKGRGMATTGVVVGGFSAVASLVMFVVPLVMGGITWDGSSLQIGVGPELTTGWFSTCPQRVRCGRQGVRAFGSRSHRYVVCGDHP